MNNIVNLYQSNRTVFTTRDVAHLLDFSNMYSCRNRLHRQKTKKTLKNITTGLWGLPKYNIYELANKIRVPSYISLETALQKGGIIFQDYSGTITLVSNNTFQKNINNIIYSYRKIRNTILFNTLGIINNGIYSMASPERALCDMIYLSPTYYFDNPESLNIDLLEQLADSSMYPQKTTLRIKKLIEHVKQRKS